jgi:hypothetical protein
MAEAGRDKDTDDRSGRDYSSWNVDLAPDSGKVDGFP